MASSDVDDMDAHDIAALQLAIAAVRDEGDRERIEQIESILEDDGFFEGGKSAAFHCQCKALDLKPWQSPPMSADEDDPDPDELHLKDAQRLLRRMLKAGISRWHPDPLRAIAEAAK